MIEALHSRYLRCLGRVFNLCRLFVLDLNHSDQWNTLLSAGGEIFHLTNLVTPLGKCISVVLIFLSLQLLSESRLCFLQLFSVISTFWLALFGFETSRSVQVWVILVFYALFPYSIQQYFPRSSLFLTSSIVLLMFSSSTGNRAYAVYEKRCHQLNKVDSTRCHRL